MTDTAYLSHVSMGRTRLRVMGRRRDVRWFEEARRVLSGCKGVVEVHANPRTGSLLVRHTNPLDRLLAFAEEQGLFTVEEREHTPSPGANVFPGWDRDLANFLPLLLIVLGTIQLVRGQALAPAFTIFAFAMQLAAKSRR